MHGAGGGADIALSRGMCADEMRQPCHAPRLVYRGGGGDAVTYFAADHLSEVGEMVAGVAIGPAAKIGKGRRHFPVVKGLERL